MLFEGAGVVGEGSSAECWVDDNYAGANVIKNAADVGDPISTYVLFSFFLLPTHPSDELLVWFDQYVKRGSHFVECQLLSVPMFKIIGIFAR